MVDLKIALSYPTGRRGRNLLMTNPNTPTCSKIAPSDEGASNDTNPSLPMGQLFGQLGEWPKEIIIEPSRLASGVWRDGEGDISAAYCADTFPKIRTFVHKGHLFTNTGGSDNYASCYPLIPNEEYKGVLKKPYSHEGESVSYKGQSFRLGPKIMFKARERTIEEQTDLLRRQYAYGGYFVSGRTFREMLIESLDTENLAQTLEAAIKQELERNDLPNTQSEMRAQFGEAEKTPEADSDNAGFSQPALPGFE